MTSQTSDDVRGVIRISQLVTLLLLLCATCSTRAFEISCESLCASSNVVGSHFCDCQVETAGALEKRSGNTARSYNRIFKWGKREPEEDAPIHPGSVNRRIFRWGKRSGMEETQFANDDVTRQLQTSALLRALSRQNVGMFGRRFENGGFRKRDDKYNKIFTWG